MFRFECLLSIPPSINQCYAARHIKGRTIYYKTKKARDWENSQYIPKQPLFEGRLKVTYRYAFKDKRIRDISNYVKILDDFLEGKIFKNDNQIDEANQIRLPIDRDNPGVFITLEEMT